jgi:putative oxidoreductase
MPGPIPARWGPCLLSVLRMVAAFLYMAHGTQKLFVWPASEPGHAVTLFSLMGLAGVLEVFGGLLLFLGLFTRPIAFVLAGEMAVAYFLAHAPRGFWPILNHGELPVLYCFLFLYLGAVGGGPWSLDALRARRH